MLEAKNGEELLRICESENIPLSEYAIRIEMENREITREEAYARMRDVLQAMKDGANEGRAKEVHSVSGLIGGDGYKKKAEENMVNLVKEAQESKKKIIMSAMVSVLVIVAAVPLFVVAGMFEMQVWARVLLMGIGFAITVMGIAIACVLDREAGAFECPECKERFVPDMKSYVMGPHTITKRKLTCPKCGCTKYCKHVLTR